MGQLAELIKMLLDAIKLLLEEPGKLLKAFLSLSKLVLTLVCTEWIYRKAYGNYHFIDFTSLSEWSAYLLSGRILTGMLFFAVSYAVLFWALPGVSGLPFTFINYLVKTPIKIGATEGALIFRLLRRFKLLYYNSQVYNLKYFPDQLPVDIKLVNQCLGMAKEEMKKMILFTEQEVYPEALRVSAESSQHVMIVTFNGREDLSGKVKKLLRMHVLK